MRKARMLGVAMAAALAVAPAHAVDVDRIEIRSTLGEPLLAEIPITGATPQDLQQLQAQLASSTTFARIGLPRPEGVVADLRFEVVRGARPLIRVTSSLPVEEDFLTFLVQVDAPLGRLVREYSVSLGAVPTLAAPVEPQIQMPAQAANNVIARQPDPAEALPAPLEPAIPPSENPPPPPIPLHADQRPASAPPRPEAAPGAGRAPPSRAPEPLANGAAVRALPVRSEVPASATGPARQPGDYTVRPGDSLTRIVERMPLAGATAPQAMLALLRTNPHAFGSGNINLLRRGAVLRVPTPVELTRLDAVAAEAMVRLQIQQWRSGEMPPVESIAAATTSNDMGDRSRPTARVAPARLELAPPGDAVALASGPGSTRHRAGTAAERDREAAELVATRYTEFKQMQQRIAELEHAQKAQQRLIELKNRQLAAQRPRSAGMWTWLVAALGLAMAAAAFWRRARPGAPGRVARRLSAMVRGSNAENGRTSR